MSLGLFVLLTLLGAFGLIHRFRFSSSRFSLLVLVAATSAVVLAIAPWPEGRLFESSLIETHLVIVDVSESMGPDLGAILSRDSIAPPKEGRLVVVAAGSKPTLVFDGEAKDYPDKPRPGVVSDDVEARLSCQMDEALRDGLTLLRGTSSHIKIVSDGGFDAFLPQQVVAELPSELASFEVVAMSFASAQNLAIAFSETASSFVPGEELELVAELRGYLSEPQTVEIQWQVEGQAAQSQTLVLPAGRQSKKLAWKTSPLTHASGSVSVALPFVKGDLRSTDNQDSIALIAAESQPRLLYLAGSAATPLNRESLAGFRVLRDVSDVAGADVIVINDLSFDDLKGGASSWQNIEKAVLSGTGLLLGGAKSAFGLGGWEDQIPDRLSPLKSKPGQKNRTLVVAVDRSGSMEKNRRFERAANVVRATFERLGQKDKLVLLLFSSDVEVHEFGRKEQSSADRLSRVLTETLPSGGTNLTAVFDRIVEMAHGENEDVLTIVLTDGRDPAAFNPKNLARWKAGVQKNKSNLRLMWFDRDDALKSTLRSLVSSDDALIEVDDFGLLQRPFFDALNRGLILPRGDYVRQDGVTVTIDRVLRTRPDERATSLVQGADEVRAVARLDQTVAAPLDLSAGDSGGVFGSAGLNALLKSLTPAREGRGGILRSIEQDGKRRLELSGLESSQDQIWWQRGDQKKRVVFQRVGPNRWLSELGVEPPRQPFVRLVDAKGAPLGSVPVMVLAAQDLGPKPSEETLTSLRKAAHRPWPSAVRRSAIDLSFLLLGLGFFALDLLARSLGR